MIRILATIAVGAVLGLGFGQLQSRLATSGYEERFAVRGPRWQKLAEKKRKPKWLRNRPGVPKSRLLVEPNSNLVRCNMESP